MAQEGAKEERTVPPERAEEDSISLASNDSLESSVDFHAIPVTNLHTNEPKDTIPKSLTQNDAAPVKTRSRLSMINSRTSAFSINRDFVVPRNKRRGILAQFTLIPEYENSRNYPNKLKYSLIFVIACCAVIGPLGTSIMMPAINTIAEELHTDVSIVNGSVGIYLFTMGVLPIYWSNYSEAFGRRSIYVISFSMCVVFSIGCALSTNIGMLIAFRVLSGAATASAQSVGAGSVGDLFAPHERGTAMGIYYLGPLGGPLFAPIIGGILTQYLGWRSTQWFMGIFAAVCSIAIILFLPETMRKEDNSAAIRAILAARRKAPRDLEEEASESTADSKPVGDIVSPNVDGVGVADIKKVMSNRSVISLQRSVIRDEEEEEEEVQPGQAVESYAAPLSRARTNQQSEFLERVKQNDLEKLKSKVAQDGSIPEKSKWRKFKENCYFFLLKPLKSVVFLRYPPVFFMIAYAGPIFSCTYFLNLTLTYSYSRPPYNFPEILVGLVYIPNAVAYVIASIWGGRWTDKLLKDYADKHNGESAPEARIGINVWTAAILYPISLLIAGWCLDKKTQWVTPLIGTAVFGFASMIVIGTTVTYVVDSLPGRGATGVALNNLVRMSLSTGATFITEPLIKALGIGVLFTILAALCAVLSGLLLVLKKRGTHWRETYDLEKLYDMLD